MRKYMIWGLLALFIAGALIAGSSLNKASAAPEAANKAAVTADQDTATDEQGKAEKLDKGQPDTDNIEEAVQEGLQGESAAEDNKADVQEPAYKGSVAAPADNGKEENKADEQKLLSTLAKITAQQAEDAAIKAVPGGQAIKAELENENGYVVYGVQVKAQNKNLDVKVDAGNGQVLSIQSDDNTEEN